MPFTRDWMKTGLFSGSMPAASQSITISRVFGSIWSTLVIRRERVPVGHHVEILGCVLERDPVLERAEVVP